MIKKIIITLLVFNLLFLTAGCSGNMNKTALTINSNKISVEEFIFAANICKSETILYFTSKYNASDVSNDEFWENEFGNECEKPIDVLKEKSIEYLKNSYAVFSLSEKADIINDISFENIKDISKTLNPQIRYKKIQAMKEHLTKLKPSTIIFIVNMISLIISSVYVYLRYLN